MLLLLWLAVVTQLTGATLVNISDCRVAYFGKLSTSVKITTNGSGQASICFLETGSTDAGGDCIHSNMGGVLVSTSTTAPSKCSVLVSFQKDAQNMSSEFALSIAPSGTVGSLGKQTTLKINSSYQATEFKIFVGDKLLQTLNYNGSETSTDLTGCRHKGAFLQKGQQMCEMAFIVSCSAVGEIVKEQCAVGEKCSPKPTSSSAVHECTSAPQCALVGPVMVDFAGRVGLVPDLCSYTLLETDKFGVVAEFRERRRTDMGFPHRVILTAREPSNHTNTFIIGPGRQVQVNGSRLSLSEGLTPVESVLFEYTNNLHVGAIFLGQTNWTIVFDGTSVLITGVGDGRFPEGLQGLCMNITNAESFKDQTHSPDSCGTVHTQPPDRSINCTTQTERCAGLLPDGLIQSCEDSLPLHQPFFKACSQTLCKYPDQDELYCHFFNSFALMCKPEQAKNYMTMAQCPLNECADTVCRDSEFCELSPSKVPHCRCRAGVYQDFKQRETTCQNQQASVSIPLCVLTEKGLNVSDLHLNQESCQGTVDHKEEQITFNFNSSAQCGTQKQEQGGKIVYQNTVQFNSSSDSGLISRKSSFKLDFSCFYSQPNLKTFHLHTKGVDGLQAAIKGSWNYNITVGMFSDINLKKPIDFSKGLKMNSMIYISIESEGMDGALLLMKADNCYVTDRKETGGLKYSLISGGCGNPKDSTIKVFPAKGNRGTVIRIEMFQFKGGKGKMFLKCKMKLCLASTPGCKPNCDSTKSGKGNNGKGNKGSAKQRRSLDTLETDQDDIGYFVVPL